MHNLKNAIEQLKVLIIGDVMLDCYEHGRVTRISPEAPVPVVLWEREEIRLGGAANVALNVKALGATPFLVSIVGADDYGSALRNAMSNHGMSADAILTDKSRPTTVKKRVVSQSQQLLRLDYESTAPINAAMQTKLKKAVKQLLEKEKVDLIIFQDYNKGLLTLPLINFVLTLAKQKGITTAVDPKADHFFDYKGVTLFKPNLKECKEALKINIRPVLEDLVEASKLLRKKLSHTYTMITLSDKGVFIDNGKEQVLLPTVARHIADVSGAGDTVISIAAMALAAGADMPTFGYMGNLAAGLVCAQPGVVPVASEAFWAEIK